MKTSMRELRSKSLLLTAYLEHLLTTTYPKPSGGQDDGLPYVEIITPTDPQQRGNQLSIKLSINVVKVFDELKKRAVVVSVHSMQLF